MTINKWNNKKKMYEPYEVPDTWKLTLFSCNMDEIINCTNCGKEIEFGDGYTSQRYYSNNGMAYSECKECYFSYKE